MLCYDVRAQIFSPNIIFGQSGREEGGVTLEPVDTSPILVHQLKTQLARPLCEV